MTDVELKITETTSDNKNSNTDLNKKAALTQSKFSASHNNF